VIFFNILNSSIKDSVVLLRCDFNISIVGGLIVDPRRIDTALETIKLLINCNNIIVLVSHLGRPKNQIDNKYTLKIVCDYLNSKLPKVKITFIVDIYKDYNKTLESAQKGQIIFLENIRFYPEEESNDENFKKFLAKGTDVYCNEAFSCCHRTHASIMIAELFPKEKRFIGLAMNEEIESLNSFSAKNNSIAVIGGSKISTKINVLRQLQKKLQKIIVVGAMANTLLKYKGFNIGKSLSETGCEDICEEILNSNNCEIIIPEYFIVTDDIVKSRNIEEKHISTISDNDIIVDIGIKSVNIFLEIIKKVEIVLWNGPFGIFEIASFDIGTTYFAKKLAELTKNNKIKSVIGGGDTLSAIKNSVDFYNFTHVSDAGGAFLEYIESDGKLVGLMPLRRGV
jgi:phosphoglycerate kinase